MTTAKQKNWVTRFGVCVIVILLIVVITKIVIQSRSSGATGSSASPTVPVSTTLKVGDKIPQTGVLGELFGTSRATVAGLGDHHPMVINFFASYCTACEAEMKNFATISNAEHGISFIGVDTEEPNIKAAQTLITKARVNYPILEDTNGNVLTTPYGVASLPSTFFVNASGKIIAEKLGYESAAQLKAQLAAL
jgi:peroxiredoxin